MTATDIKRLLNKALNRIRVAGTGADTDGPGHRRAREARAYQVPV